MRSPHGEKNPMKIADVIQGVIEPILGAQLTTGRVTIPVLISVHDEVLPENAHSILPESVLPLSLRAHERVDSIPLLLSSSPHPVDPVEVSVSVVPLSVTVPPLPEGSPFSGVVVPVLVSRGVQFSRLTLWVIATPFVVLVQEKVLRVLPLPSLSVTVSISLLSAIFVSGLRNIRFSPGKILPPVIV